MGKRNCITIEVEISDREQAFLDNLARGTKPTQAAIDAGWSGPTAARLLAKRHIQALIRKGLANLQAVVARIDHEATLASADDEAEA
jgi:phage terminase small subunit